MAIKIETNELPPAVRRSVADTVTAVFSDSDGDWSVSLTAEPKNNAWDVEINGPESFHWMRRFSGDDRDADVIAEAVRLAVDTAGDGVNEALSVLATQGIAFASDTGSAGETEYIVDRVRLKESEIVYLHRQHALTANGIRKYLLTRNAA